jgi:ABC-type polysaccharide/polyol phosphate export permease
MIQNLTTVWKFRHFLLALVRLDLRLRYRRSILGVGWSLLNPIAMTIVFAVVFSKILGGDNLTQYVPHLLIGLAVWGFLKESAIAGSRAFLQSESYIRQSPLPLGIYPLRVVLGQAIHSTIAIAVAVVVTLVYQPYLTKTTDPLAIPLAIVSIIPGLILMFLVAWSAATIFAFVNVYFQDTQHLLEVAAQLLFFLTPIIYPEGKLQGKAWWWLELNPVQVILKLIRTPLMEGDPPTMGTLLAGLYLAIVMIILAVGTATWLRKRVIFQL